MDPLLVVAQCQIARFHGAAKAELATRNQRVEPITINKQQQLSIFTLSFLNHEKQGKKLGCLRAGQAMIRFKKDNYSSLM
jgi:hypothetical protein